MSQSQAVTGNKFFRTITEEILDYVTREMTDPDGGFYSTQDADSEGEEGKFFVWTPDEIQAVLDSDADDFMAAYGVTRHGNFKGKNILEFVSDMHQHPAPAVPLLYGRELVDGHAAAYVCRNFAYEAQVTKVDALQEQLELCIQTSRL